MLLSREMSSVVLVSTAEVPTLPVAPVKTVEDSGDTTLVLASVLRPANDVVSVEAPVTSLGCATDV